MDRNKAKVYLEYLTDQYAEWCSNPKKRSKIAEEIRYMTDHWDDDIYLYLNEDRATGLFEPGFFESDVKRAFLLLKRIINDKEE